MSLRATRARVTGRFQEWPWLGWLGYLGYLEFLSCLGFPGLRAQSRTSPRCSKRGLSILDTTPVAGWDLVGAGCLSHLVIPGRHSWRDGAVDTRTGLIPVAVSLLIPSALTPPEGTRPPNAGRGAIGPLHLGSSLFRRRWLQRRSEFARRPSSLCWR